MAIEFRCSQCSQLLRVPDDSAGKNARCPKCQALMTVPAASTSPAPLTGAVTPFSPSPPPMAPAPFTPSAPPSKPAAAQPPFAGQPAGGAGGGLPPPPSNPFAGLGTAPPPKPAGSPFGDAGAYPASTNPYASPAYAPMALGPPGSPITPVVVPLDPIMSHAFRVWQANLGILVVVTVIPFAISMVIAIPLAIAQVALDANNAHEGAVAVSIIGQVLQNLVAVFLGIGQTQISLKLARGMPAAIGDLFAGGPRFLPVLLAGLIFVIVAYAGFLACLVPGILWALWFWPFYFLLIEERASIMGSFSLASKITEGNRATAFILFLCGLGIGLLGCLAICVGMIFALPLVSVMWATAYLMMSGQLPSQPQYVR